MELCRLDLANSVWALVTFEPHPPEGSAVKSVGRADFMLKVQKYEDKSY